MNKFQFLAVVMLFFLGIQKNIFAQSPDMILINGKIFTSDTAELYVEALAIKGIYLPFLPINFPKPKV